MALDDLSSLLRDLSVTRRPGRWCMITSPPADPDMVVAASIVEDEGVTSVVSVADAERLGHRPEFVAAWLTLDVESALDSVGLTATVATALAGQQIPCNVLAGFHHDHLLVPEGRADEAMAILRSLGRPRKSTT
jgi:uncharacterized protein